MSRTLFDEQDYDQSCGPVCNQLPVARNSDPGTSKQAVAEIAHKLNRCQAGLFESFRRMQSYECATASEAAADAYERDPSSGSESYRKRLGELVHAGLVVEAGVRRCRVTGKSARTFKVR